MMVRAGVLIAGILALAAVPARAELVVTISKADQSMSVKVDGSEMYRWPVSTGLGRHGTPNGQFRPVRFERSWYSRKYGNAPMPYSIFFHKGYAVHGTTELRQLGRPASHGCVRLHPENAATLFSLASVNTRSTRIVVTHLRLDGSAVPAPERRQRDRAPRYRGREPAVKQRLVPSSPYGFEAFGKASPDEDKARQTPAKTVPIPAATSQVREPPARAMTARADNVPAAALRPGSHVVTMKVGSDAELRAVYRKYGFTW